MEVREILSVIGDDSESRYRIILEFLIPAKELGVKTDESVFYITILCSRIIRIRHIKTLIINPIWYVNNIAVFY